MENRYEEAKKYIDVIVTEAKPSNDVIEDIAWKFTIGDIILSIADQRGFKGLKPGNNMEVFEGDGTHLEDIMIGDSLCILVRKANKETISESESSESQPNPDDDISGPGL